MQHPTCCAIDCTHRAVYVALGLCRIHYQEHRRSLMREQQCSVSGCVRPVGAPRSLCAMHFSRLRNTGHVGTSEPKIIHGTRRNVTQAGYVRLNRPDHPLAMADGWVFEHRLVAWETFGPFDTSMHVHHINGDKSDNRPGNLELLTPEEHGREHSTLDWPLAADMYASGSTTTHIARTLGTHPGNVSRMLRSAGVTMRTISEAKLMSDPSPDEVHRAALGASSATEIAARLGVGVGTARRLMRQHGIPSFPVGRRRVAA